MPTKYTYTISTDTANAKVDSDKLKKEIQNSTIPVSLNNGPEGQITIGGDILDVWMASLLSITEAIDLDTIVNAHDGVSLALPVEEVRINQEKTKTGGHPQFCTFNVVCDATTGWKVSDPITFPIPINIIRGGFASLDESIGDQIEFSVAADAIVGAITADVTASDTIINVSSTVIDNIQVGFWAKLSGGGNDDDLGRVKTIDSSAGTITVETAAVNAFSAASPTYVKMTAKFVPLITIPGGNLWVPLNGGEGSSYIPAGTVLNARYNNITATAKTFIFLLEYFY